MTSLPDFGPDWLPIRFIFHSTLYSQLSIWAGAPRFFPCKIGCSSGYLVGLLEPDGILTWRFECVTQAENESISEMVASYALWEYDCHITELEESIFVGDKQLSKVKEFSKMLFASLNEELLRLVEQRSFELAGRINDRIGQPMPIPPDFWNDIEILDWQRGHARIRPSYNNDNSSHRSSHIIYSLHFRPATLLCSSDLIRTRPSLISGKTVEQLAKLLTENCSKEEIENAPAKVLLRRIEALWAEIGAGRDPPSERTLGRAREAVLHRRSAPAARSAIAAPPLPPEDVASE